MFKMKSGIMPRKIKQPAKVILPDVIYYDESISAAVNNQLSKQPLKSESMVSFKAIDENSS